MFCFRPFLSTSCSQAPPARRDELELPTCVWGAGSLLPAPHLLVSSLHLHLNSEILALKFPEPGPLDSVLDALPVFLVLSFLKEPRVGLSLWPFRTPCSFWAESLSDLEPKLCQWWFTGNQPQGPSKGLDVQTCAILIMISVRVLTSLSPGSVLRILHILCFSPHHGLGGNLITSFYK